MANLLETALKAEQPPVPDGELAKWLSTNLKTVVKAGVSSCIIYFVSFKV